MEVGAEVAVGVEEEEVEGDADCETGSSAEGGCGIVLWQLKTDIDVSRCQLTKSRSREC